MTVTGPANRTVRIVAVDATGQIDQGSAREIPESGPGASPASAGPSDADPNRARGAAAHDARRAVVTPLPTVRAGARRVEVVVDGWRFELEIEDAARAAIRRRATRERDAAATSGPLEIRAIIPGRVAAVRVAPGDEVAAGDTLLVVEAMKMQNELRAARSGSIERVAVGQGDTIEIGDLLVVLG